MDLETENRIAAILLKEAAELRRRAEEEGVHSYLHKPNVRGRPNSRFLSATVLGVQQANRTLEVNEMWRVRRKELELDNSLGGGSSEDGCNIRRHESSSDSRSRSKKYVTNETDTSESSSKRVAQDYYHREDDSLKDDEVEEFLHSRVKRGRGAVGSRMDETGPYLPCPDPKEKQLVNLDVREECESRVVLGPQGPSSLLHEDERRKRKKSSSSMESSKKHRSKEKYKYNNKVKRNKKKRSKHR